MPKSYHLLHEIIHIKQTAARLRFKVIEGLKRALVFFQHWSAARKKRAVLFFPSARSGEADFQPNSAEFAAAESGQGATRRKKRHKNTLHRSRGCLQVEQGPSERATGSLASRGLILNCIYSVYPSGAKCVRFGPVSAIHHPYPVLSVRANMYYLFRFLDLSQCGYPHFPIFRHSCTRLQSAAAAADTMRAARALPGASCQILGRTLHAGNLSALQLQHMNHHPIQHPLAAKLTRCSRPALIGMLTKKFNFLILLLELGQWRGK
jgi:hypothetical protein